MDSRAIEYKELLSDYEQGLYTDIELVSKTLNYLKGGDSEIWICAPAWVKEKIKDKVSVIGDSDQFISFSGQSSEEIKKQLIELREWLIKQNELKIPE